jgi:putative Mn2+ efflux pump MntP
VTFVPWWVSQKSPPFFAVGAYNKPRGNGYFTPHTRTFSMLSSNPGDSFGFLPLIIIAIGLAMDAFAVSLGIGTTQQAQRPRPILRLSFHMGIFQGLMTLVGWLAGSSIIHWIAGLDHWVAFALLAYVGSNMIRSSQRGAEANCRSDPSRGRTLIVLCLACSLDALAVGLSLAMLQVDILTASLTIAVVSLGFSLIGLLAGHQLGVKFGRRMEILGGLILIGIGLRILISHSLG